MNNKELVICRRNEEVQWLDNINFKISLYDKSPFDSDPKGIKTEDIGREEYVYLKHIINNYDNLADITIFSQADPVDHLYHAKSINRKEVEIEFINKLNDMKEIKGYLGLSTTGEDMCLSEWGDELPLNKFYNDLFGHPKAKCEHGMCIYPFAIGAIFAVTKDTILKHEKSFYEKLLDMCLSGRYNAPNSRVPYYRGNASPWLMERFWQIIFTYESKKVENKLETPYQLRWL